MSAFCKVTYYTLGQPSAEQSLLEHRQITVAQREVILSGELKAAYQRIATLEADLHECLAYFEDNYDVVDTFDGEQGPNEEMRLGTMINCTLYGPGNFR